MYQHVMVPLDGSKLAECVLPHVAAITSGCGVKKITFVRVIEPYKMGFAEARAYVKEDQLKENEQAEIKEAREYLAGIVKMTKRCNDTVVESILLSGDDAGGAIADYANKNDIDLVMLASHGRSGINRWVWGSTTDKILRAACVPITMVRSPGCVPAKDSEAKIL